MKRYIILIIVILLFGFSLYYFVGKDSIKAQKVKTTILLNNDTVFEYNNRSWIKVNDSYINDYNWKEFDVFLDSTYKGKKLVWHDDEWYIFDKNKNAVNYNERFIGVKANYEINVKDFEIISDEDNGYANALLSEYHLPATSELTSNDKVIVDIDNDGENEEIYIISNTFPMDTEPDTIFSSVFMIKNNQKYQIFEQHHQDDVYSGCLPYINSILDVDNDDNYEIVLTCARFSAQEPINILYKFDKTKFNKLISNE